MQESQYQGRTLDIALDEMDAFRYLVREQLRLDCTHLSESEGDGADLEDDLGEFLDRLALFARLAADLERGATSFTLSSGDLPAFRFFLRDVAFAEHEYESCAEREGEVVVSVECAQRLELVDALAAQIGGLY